MAWRAVLDTSVVLKWFRQEELLAGPALALRAAYLEGEVLLSEPALLVYELANVLRFKSDLTTEQVQEAVESLLGMGWDWAGPSRQVLRRAVEIARGCEIKVYDAVFAALAEVENAVFVTADARLVERLGGPPSVRFLGATELA